MSQTVTYDEIKAGKVTDVYFERTREILHTKKGNQSVRAEFVAKGLPGDTQWAVLAGLDDAFELLSELPVSVRSMDEGSFFHRDEPVLELEGVYKDFCIYETALLGFLCQASGVMTRAARCRQAAGDRVLISFGARRMHPSIAPMIERNAYIGGCDSVATLAASELLGIEPSGTIPHALILLLGGVVEALKAFDEVISTSVERIALVDTFGDERFESLQVAEELGAKLFAVRLDTPDSRRGDFRDILEEVRWELDLRGFQDVRLFASGGITEERIRDLNPVADGYGVGTYISDAPVINFSMDLVEIEGEPISKRGKASGAKQVYLCPKCGNREIVPLKTEYSNCSCGASVEPLLTPLLHHGEAQKKERSPDVIRQAVLQQLARYG